MACCDGHMFSPFLQNGVQIFLFWGLKNAKHSYEMAARLHMWPIVSKSRTYVYSLKFFQVSVKSLSYVKYLWISSFSLLMSNQPK